MNLNLKGKIGRLPLALRDEVNVRLRNGETGRVLAEWLNGLPEVQALLAAEFGGKAVREQNISEWRRGGYQHWLRVQEAYGMMERMGAGGLPPESEMTGALATWVTAKYLVAAKSAEGMGEDKPASWVRMREFCQDVVALRRVDLRARRLALDEGKVVKRMEDGGWMRAGVVNDEANLQSVSDVGGHFPLTPALPLGERENVEERFVESGSACAISSRGLMPDEDLRGEKDGGDIRNDGEELATGKSLEPADWKVCPTAVGNVIRSCHTAQNSAYYAHFDFAMPPLNAEKLAQAKSLGFSDRQIAHLTGSTEDAIRAERKRIGLVPSYRLVDTCAAEFEAYTPYYYSTYDRGDDEVKGNVAKKVMILGGGPNRIGQGIEFDYCCVHAAFALKADGFETIMVNSNPETVSTDYDTSDKLFFEPLTLEDVLHIYEREKCWGAIAQFGGQTPLNLALGLQKNGVNIIGTSPQSIEIAEDRKLFAAMLVKLDIPQPPNGLATNAEEALVISKRLTYPVLVRPSFVLGGRAMQIVYSDAELAHYMKFAVEASPERPVLVDKFLEDATEVDVDCIADVGLPNGGTIVIGGMLEHIEFAGVHSGDAAMVLPPHTLSQGVIDTIRKYTHAMATELKVVGLMNVQYAVKGDTVYVLEVNPRASRTVPFVSKAIGKPLAKIAARVMAGKTLKELNFTEEIWTKYWAVKESVFPFNKFVGQDILLSPEMRSTGEVMGLDADLGVAYAKSQMAANSPLPLKGKVFISVSEMHKKDVAAVAKQFADLGFELVATNGTAAVLEKAGLKVQRINKLLEGRPNVIDLLKNKEIQFVINTPSGAAPREDEVKIRTTAVYTGTPIATTLSGAKAAALGIAALKKSGYAVKTVQEYH